MKIECPYCKTENEIEAEDLPKDCSTTYKWECNECEKEFAFGVHCELELR